MKLIAVSQRVVIHPQVAERRDALDQRWSEFLAVCGVCAVPVPNRVSIALSLVKTLQPAGLLLTGGNTLAAYGGDAPERDETELALLDWALDTNSPVLGVCRGMQVIQHHAHVPLQRVTGHVASHQTIRIDDREVEVNSYHDWGARETVPELSIRAIAKDGVIEAVRHTERCLHGIMWHPERFPTFRPADITFFREVFQL